MLKSILLFFLFSACTFAVSVQVLAGLPNNLVAGSVYTARFEFNSNIAGNYSILANISGAALGETFVNASGANCSEISPGAHNCTLTLLNGENYPNLTISFLPNIAPGSYPISVDFYIPQESSSPPASPAYPNPSGGGSGGGEVWPGGGFVRYPLTPSASGSTNQSNQTNQTAPEPQNASNNATSPNQPTPQPQNKTPKIEPTHALTQAAQLLNASSTSSKDNSTGNFTGIILLVIIAAVMVGVLMFVIGPRFYPNNFKLKKAKEKTAYEKFQEKHGGIE